MKITRKILNEYVNIEDLSINEIEEKLTMSGTKVETIDSLKGKLKDIVIGKILKIEKHPDADKLVITKTDVKDEVLQIVTGADNILEGDIVPVVKPNGVLPDGTVIKPGKLRGVMSNGMLCSSGELGVSEEENTRKSGHGILILDKNNEKYLGEDVCKVLNLDDDILDFEITPNRPDCLGTLGIGREMAASIKRKFKGYNIINSKEELLESLRKEDKDFKITDKMEDLKINIKDKDCSKYAAIVFENVNLDKTPEKYLEKLRKLGIESRGNIVDLTNYIMIELGQPLHAFDKDKIEGELNIRKAKKGEKISLLNGKEYELDGELVIAGKKSPSAVAGLMGESNQSINEDTKNIVFEIANFNGPRVRRASKKLGFRTDSSGRFEKTLPICYIYTAIKRIVDLSKEFNIGDIRKEIIIVGDGKDEEKIIEFDKDKINNHLGTDISEKEMLDILKSLEFEIIKKGKDIFVKPSLYRKDIKMIEDLAEEIIRIHGYYDLPSTLPEFLGTFKENKELDVKNTARYFLKSLGFLEMCTYSFTNEKDLEKLNLDKEDIRVKNVVKLVNKLSEDQSIMRTETLSEFLNREKYNLDMKNEKIKIFEIGRVYLKNSGEITKDNLPKEENVLSILITKDAGDFFYLKEIVYKIINEIGGKAPKISKTKDSIYHPGISADLSYGKEVIASFGEVHPEILQNFEIKEKTYFAKINLNKILKYLSDTKRYKEISKFPSSERDIAVVFDENINYEKIENVIYKASKKLIQNISLFDIFRDKEKVGENKKSVAIAIRFRADDRTLEDSEVNAEMEKILNALKKELGGEIRK